MKREKLPKQLRIEINYDAELEELGCDPDMADSRHLRANLSNRKLRSLNQDILWFEPADAECPVKIRAGTITPAQFDHTATIEFRTELNIDAIEAKWGPVEQQAGKELPFTVVIAIQKEGRDGPEEVAMDAFVKINCQTIRWTWTPLERDEDGQNVRETGDALLCEPIEIEVDGTSCQGARIELERYTMDASGQVNDSPEDSDFSEKTDPKDQWIDIVAPEPQPWKSQAKAQLRFQTSDWWTQPLTDPKQVLSKLPMETTIRIYAFPPNTITQQREGALPQTNPAETKLLAMRELPLHLEKTVWLVKVLEPTPDDPPVLLTGDKPWEDGFTVRLSVVKRNERTGEERPVVGRDLKWEIDASSDAGLAGKVSESGQLKTEGEWRTDDSGEITFTFCPERKNALFLDETSGCSWEAAFLLWKGKKKSDKPEARIRDATRANDDQPPSFRLEWAPKFDLTLFKLPYVSAEAALDPDRPPVEDTVKGTPLVLNATQENDYRLRFRWGGRIELKPRLALDPATAPDEDLEPLKDYRLIIGGEGDAKEGRKIVIVEPVAAADGVKSKSPERKTRFAIIDVPASRRGAAGGSKNVTTQSLVIAPKLPLQAKMREALVAIKKSTEDLHQTFTKADTLTKGRTLVGSEPEFKTLGADFVKHALVRFAREAQDTLLDNLKETVLSLEAVSKYLPTLPTSWDNLNASVTLHRMAYARTIDNFMNFVWDFLYCDDLPESVAKVSKKVGWQWGERLPEHIQNLKQATGVDLRKARLLDNMHDAIQAAGLRAMLGKMLRGMESALEKVRINLNKIKEALSEERAVLQTLEEAQRTAFQAFSQAADRVRKCSEALARIGQQAEWMMSEVRAVGLENIRSRPELRAKLLALVEEAKAARASFNEAIGEMTEHTRGPARGGSTEGLHNSIAKLLRSRGRTAMLESQAKALESQLERFGKASKSLSEAESTAVDLAGKNTAAIKEYLSQVQEHIKAGPPAEVLNAAQSASSAAGTAAELTDPLRDRCNGMLDDLRKVAEQEKGLRALGVLGPESTWIGRTPGQIHPTDPALDFSGVLDRANAAAAATQQTVSRSEGALQAAQNRLQARNVPDLVDAWKAQQILVSENLSDGVQAGKEHFLSILDDCAASKSDRPSSPAPDQGQGWCGWALEKVFQLLDWMAAKFKGFIAWMASCCSALPDVIHYGSMAVLYVFNLFLRLVARVGGKIFEAVLAGFDTIRSAGGFRTVSYISDGAFAAGDRALAKAGADCPGKDAAASELFTFPYLECRILERWKECSHIEGDYSRREEEELDKVLRAGYEDYYPKAMSVARRCYYALCYEILTEEFLASPPLDEDASASLQIGTQAVGKFSGHIQEMLQAFTDARPEDGGGEFTDSLRRLRDKPKWSAADWDSLADWFGFFFTWVVRAIALVVALLTWWSGVGLLVSAGTMLLASSLGNAVVAVVRLATSMVGYYLYTTVYPRDTVVLQAAVHAALFLPKNERYKPSSADDLYKA